MKRNLYAETVAEGVFERLEIEPNFPTTRSKLNTELQRYRDYLGYDDDDCSMRKCQDQLYQMIRINYREVTERTITDGRAFIGIGFENEVEEHREKEERYQREIQELQEKQKEQKRKLEEKRLKNIAKAKREYNESVEKAKQQWEHWINIDRPLLEEVGFKVKTISQNHFIDSDGNKEIVSGPNYPRVPPSFASDEKKNEYSNKYLKYLNLKKERYGEESLTDRQKAKLAQRVS